MISLGMVLLLLDAAQVLRCWSILRTASLGPQAAPEHATQETADSAIKPDVLCAAVVMCLVLCVVSVWMNVLLCECSLCVCV